ncbi:MAG: gliding motility-associated C-terminal domain-containing protein [Bacteroidetes bacterium]|nr:gliding motility-associated C-terminal domain-containing protein [Bacteroidota bacterium]
MYSRLKKGIIFFLFVIFALSGSGLLHAQKEANFWYFGQKQNGLDFTSFPPSVISNGKHGAPPSPQVVDNIASISNAQGNLLFYTDGITVWDKSHNQMPNGTGLLGCNGSTCVNLTQQVLILKKPGPNTIYYIFYIHQAAGPPTSLSLYYSEVDMAATVNGGLGDVVATSKNTLVYSGTTQKLAAVKHANCQDIWVVSHEAATSSSNTNKYRSYLLTSSGLNLIPTISPVGTTFTATNPYAAGQLKISPTGFKLALAGKQNVGSLVDLCDFNPATGAVTNAQTIPVPGAFGVEFSPNGKYLYAAGLGTGASKNIFQVDVCATTPTLTIVGTSADNVGSLQLGPDKKIYVCRVNTKNIGVINQPNSAGVACNYVDNGVTGLTVNLYQGLTSFIASYFKDTVPRYTYTTNCLNYSFTSPPSSCAYKITSYNWNFGDPASGLNNTSVSANPTHTFTIPGNYTVKLILNGCADTLSQIINVTACPLIPTITATNPICPGACSVVSASVTGGSPPYTYNWSPNIGSGVGPYNVCPTVTTVYTVSVSDAALTSTVTSFTVTVHPQTVANLTTSTITCSGFPNGSITATPGVGPGPYSYTWQPSGATTAAISGLGANTYTVTIKDANNCTTKTTATITAPPPLTLNTNISATVSCFNGSNGSIAAVASGGVGSYTYVWSTGQSTITASTLNVHSNLSAGTFSVTVTDGNGCSSTKVRTITQPSTALSLSLTVNNHVSCAGGSNGAATASASGGTGAYTFTWSNASNTASATGLSAAIYSATVRDANGCSVTGTISITEPPASISASANVVSNVSCFNGSNGSATAVPAGGVGSYTYSWSNAATSATVTTLNASTHTVTITDSNGCAASATVAVSQPSLAVVATTSLTSNVLCFGGNTGSGSAAASGGTGPYTFVWSNSTSGSTANSLLANTYTVTVTDANNCSDTETLVITQPAQALTTSAIQTQSVGCVGGSNGIATANAVGGTGGYTYLWSNNATTSAIATIAAGNYTVTISDANGCTQSSTVNIGQPSSVVTANANINNHVACLNGANGSVTAIGSGGSSPYSYSWKNTGITTATATGLGAQTYTVDITDNNGCPASTTVTLTQPATALSATTTVINNVSCFNGNNGSASVNASGGIGGYTYSWLNPVNSTLTTVNNLSANTYTISVTDANNCMIHAFVTITQPAVTVSSTVTVTQNVNCFNGTDGAATVNASGGSTPYTYSWTNGSTSTSVNSLPATNYTVTVTDASGCSSANTFTITQPPALSHSITTQTNVSCFGGSNGSVTIIGTGGNSGYQYSWSTSATGTTITGNTAGVYNFTIEDANACTYTNSVAITEPATALTASIAANNQVSCFAGNNGQATINASGGTANYTYLWSANNQSTQIGNNLPAGIHSATVNDANGCTATATVQITEPSQALSVSLVENGSISCFNGTNGSITATGNGGTTNYTFSWTGLTQTTNTITNIGAGTYIVTITDANLCTVVDSISITQPVAISISATSAYGICQGNNANLTASATGGSGVISFTWSDNQTGPSVFVSPSATTIYNVTATDANNCSTTATINVNVSTPLSITVNTTSTTICDGTSATLSASASGGLGNNYTFTWNPGSTNTAAITVSPSTNTNYTLSVSNACGTKDTNITITVNPLPVVSFTANDPDGCPTHCVLFTNTTPNTGGVTWYFGDGSTSDTTPTTTHCYVNSGVYSITLIVNDVNGCINSKTETNYIVIYPEAQADFTATPQTTSIAAPTVEFTDLSIGANSWYWSFGTALDDTSIVQNPTFSFYDPGTYDVMLVVGNQYGCKPDTITHTIKVIEDYIMYIPNSFSPNGDNKNDTFIPIGMGINIDTYELLIFDRWGNLLFESRDINIGWDGKANGGGTIAQIDTYVWKIKLKDTVGNKHSFVGHVNILR